MVLSKLGIVEVFKLNTNDRVYCRVYKEVRVQVAAATPGQEARGDVPGARQVQVWLTKINVNDVDIVWGTTAPRRALSVSPLQEKENHQTIV